MEGIKFVKSGSVPIFLTAPEGSAAWRDWLTNIPSMPLMYVAAVGVELLRTFGILDQPAPPLHIEEVGKEVLRTIGLDQHTPSLPSSLYK